jgi:uncharacterized protein
MVKRFTREQVLEIRRLFPNHSLGYIGELFGIAPSTVSRIARGERYGHIKEDISPTRSSKDTMISKYGDDYYVRIGTKGGQNGHTGGFFANRELAREAGRKGGRVSRRKSKKGQQAQSR